MCQNCSLRYYYREKIQKSIGEVEDANISTLASVILEKARVNKEIDAELSPEQFAENLYVKGSLLAAEASLDDVNMSLDLVGLYKIASIIHVNAEGVVVARARLKELQVVVSNRRNLIFPRASRRQYSKTECQSVIDDPFLGEFPATVCLVTPSVLSNKMSKLLEISNWGISVF